MKTEKKWIFISGIFGFLGVAIGAFGAHGLEGKIPPNLLETFNTGVHYHLIHAVVLAAIAISEKNRFYAAAIFFSIGIILFSFSLYFYAITGERFLAMITPFGGISFLIGWIMLIIKGLKN
jgi:uncharacterized membrane protein YgdD (TMEM256/DUF423 family)